jgi:hypothetical protein
MAIPFCASVIRSAPTPERLAWSRAGDLVLLIGLYFIVAAAAFSGFYEKWGFRDTDPKFSFVAMIEGTGDRPYVYRQLLPALANGAQAALPESAVAALTQALYTPKGELKSKIASSPAGDPQYALRYHLIYYGTFLILLASLFAMRAMCLAAGYDPFVATAAPAIFTLFLPILQSVGGYYYDFSELGFMALAVLMCFKGRILWLVPLSVLATWNKESFLFFLLTLYPLMRASRPREETAATLGACLFASLATYLAVRYAYADNPGGNVQLHAIESLIYYINPLNLLGRDITYGLKSLQGYSIVMVALTGIVALRGWPNVSSSVRRHIMLAAAINLPLFFLFCYPGETRNLSMLFMGGVILLASGLSETVSRWRARGVEPPSPPY